MYCHLAICLPPMILLPSSTKSKLRDSDCITRICRSIHSFPPTHRAFRQSFCDILTIGSSPSLVVHAPIRAQKPLTTIDKILELKNLLREQVVPAPFFFYCVSFDCGSATKTEKMNFLDDFGSPFHFSLLIRFDMT